MPLIDVDGVQVNFPFEPYPCQMNYMRKVIACLKEDYNGILESPTGTGKTLCLLCASLAWLENKKAQIQNQRRLLQDADLNSTLVENVYKDDLSKQLDLAAGVWNGQLNTPKIIYASRTHSQLSQAMQELKRTAYVHFRATVIGSREQLCIHPHIMKEQNNTAKVHLCRAKVSARSCHFYNQVENGKGNFANQVLDIEDLVTLGQKWNCCPYYVTRELKNEADIIFMPYNYLLDPKLRKAHGVELQGNIVIFDEAHNLEQICEDSSSFDLSSGDVACALKELDHLAVKIQEWHQAALGSVDLDSHAVQDFTLEDVLQIKAQLMGLETGIDGIEIKDPSGITKDGSFIFEIFDKINLTFDNKNIVYNLLEKMVAHLSNDASGSIFNSRGYGLSKILDVIKIVFSAEPTDFTPLSNHKKAVSKHYKVHIRANTATKKKKCDGWGSTGNSSSGRIFSYWCFSPGHTMKDLKSSGVKSIILTSGTLSPLSSFSSEMGINFQIQLENPHVIENEQVWIGTIGKGPDGVRLSSAYDTRFKHEYQISLGNAVVNFARAIPSGLLLFFPSYPVMETCLEKWQASGLRGRIEQHKALFVEPKSKLEFSTAMDNFYEKVSDPSTSGAIFSAVCRGKVSEGLDFSDGNGRAVVITGLPFPPRMDPKVILKMKFLDQVKVQAGNGSLSLSGDDWYKQQASRAVNQAIGRVIRHRHDYGAILLCDARFCDSYSNQLPLWLRPAVRNYENFGQAMRDMMAFFKTAEKLFPPPKQTSKRKRPGDAPGCQGAYFMPSGSTVPRKRAIQQLDKASAVTTDVPSLGPIVRDDLSLERLKRSYGGTLKVTEKPRGGLLMALSENERTMANPQLDEFEPPSLKEVAAIEASVELKPRKRIALKVENSKVGKDTLETAESYIKEVKKVLSNHSYLYFSKTLTEYKAAGQLDAMVKCLNEIFGQDVHNHHLFRKFIRYIKREDREIFQHHCIGLLGPEPKNDRQGKCSAPGKRTLAQIQAD